MAMNVGGNDDGNPGYVADINITPFVDVMLVLLIIFMVTAPLMTTGMPVELPRVEAPPLPAADEQMILSITKDKKAYINDHEFSLTELEAKLGAIAKANPDQQIFLRADGEVPYETVARVMAICTKAGIAKLGMVTQPGTAEAP